MGGAATGLLVEVNDCRPTKIEGNPDHPFSLGGTNAWQQASILGLYDPDRMRGPVAEGKESDWAKFGDWFKQNFDRAKLGDGSGLRVLSERVTSPVARSPCGPISSRPFRRRSGWSTTRSRRITTRRARGSPSASR